MPMNPKMSDWRGRVVWLVGASTGIGRAVASSLHAQGATVIVSARQAAALQAFEASHPGSQGLVLDVTDRAATQAAAERVVQEHGGLDLVLFCAGTYTPMSARQLNLDVALRHEAVNVGGAWHVLGAVLPTLLAQAAQGRGGHLSLVASVAGYRALPNALAYGPTKAALIHMAESLHLELSPLGLGISVINPGFVDTPLTAQNGFRMPALITPEEAASEMLKGWARGDFEVHFPRRFTLLLKALRMFPQALYESLVRRATGH